MNKLGDCLSVSQVKVKICDILKYFLKIFFSGNDHLCGYRQGWQNII